MGTGTPNIIHMQFYYLKTLKLSLFCFVIECVTRVREMRESGHDRDHSYRDADGVNHDNPLQPILLLGAGS